MKELLEFLFFLKTVNSSFSKLNFRNEWNILKMMIFVNRFSVNGILHLGNTSPTKIHLLPVYCKTKNNAPNTQTKTQIR